jgi:ubiquitin carboxyl-terminal hydrolase 14
MDLPAGLTNLGNTCYMNAVVQCLKTVPELRDSLRNFRGGLSVASTGVAPAQSITASLRDLYTNMDKGSSVDPIILLQVRTLLLGVMDYGEALDCYIIFALGNK